MRRLNRLSSIVLGLFLTVPAFAQYAFLDAPKFLKAYDQATLDTATATVKATAKILRHYQTPGSKTAADIDVLRSFQNNPLLASYIQKLLTPPDIKALLPFAATSTPVATPETGFDATTVADAVAQFVVQRAKEELAYDLLQRMNAAITAYPELGILLPTTTKDLPSAASSLNYNTLFSMTTSAFRMDMKSLPKSLVSLSEMPLPSDKDPNKDQVTLRRTAYITFFNSPDGLVVKVFAAIADGFINNSPISDIVEALVQLDFSATDKQTTDFHAAIGMLKALVDGLRSSDSASPWITAGDLDDLAANGELRNIYLGLLFEDAIAHGIPQADQEKFRAQLKDVSAYTDAIVIGLRSMQNELTAVEGLKESLTGPGQSTEAKLTAISTYLNTTFDLMNGALSLRWLPSDLAKAISPTSFQGNVGRLLDYVRKGTNVATFISKSDYPSAFAVSLTIVQDLLTEVKTNATTQTDTINQLQANLGQFGNLIAAMAKAGNASDMEAVITQYALPVTSYRQRYLDGFAVKLNAYLGLDFAWNISIPQSALVDQSVYAPVGVAFTWRGCLLPYLDSLTVFFGVLDVGAAASYHLSGATGTVPTFTWQDLISESANIILGLFESPVVIGAGIRLGPMIQDASSPYVNQIPWQFHTFVAVDVPVIKL
jgi:hypothetical protein